MKKKNGGGGTWLTKGIKNACKEKKNKDFLIKRTNRAEIKYNLRKKQTKITISKNYYSKLLNNKNDQKNTWKTSNK